jgi:hypothetical protein
MHVRTGLLLAFAAFSLPYPVIAGIGGQSSSPAANAITVKITECESPAPNPYQLKNCGTMTWNGQKYDAEFSGVTNVMTKGPATTATISIQRDQQNGVTLNRVDLTGTPGVTATYTGQIAADNTISGTVVWFIGGAAFASGTWSGTVIMPAAAAPTASSPSQPISPPAPSAVPPTMPAAVPSPGIFTASIPLSIDIDEKITDQQTSAVLHRIVKVMWDGQRYMGAFDLQRSDGTTIGQYVMGFLMLNRNGSDFSFTPTGPTGIPLGKPKFEGTMDSPTHGTGSELTTDVAPNTKGKFSVEFKFTDETPSGPSSINSDFSAITINEIISAPDKFAGAQRPGKLVRDGSGYKATFGPLVGLDGKEIGFDSGGTVSVSRNGSTLTMEEKDTTGIIGITEYRGGVGTDQRGTGKFLWKTEKAGDFEGMFTIVVSNDKP